MVAPTSVMIVEDDEALLGALSFALEAEGYAVTACSSSAHALDAADGDLRCLVIDYQMHDLDGLALAEALRARGVTAPVILIATSPDRACRRGAARARAMIVEKPLLTDALSRAIQRVTRTGCDA